MNKWKSKSKKTVGIVSLLVLSVSAIAIVLAYYNHTDDIDNVMHTSTSEMVLNEIFNEQDQWVAGETKQKEVSFENTGEIEQLVRFKVVEQWLEQDVDDWVHWQEAEEDTAVTIGYTSGLTSEWTKIGDYYYYNNILGPNAETDMVMSNIEFSKNLDNGGYGSALDYSNKRYSLTIKMEAIEVNEEIAQSQWQVICSVDSLGNVTWTGSTAN